MNALAVAPGTIEALGLYAARCAALVVGAPLFGAPLGFMAWRAAFIVILAGTLFAASGQPLPFRPEPADYVLLVLREVAVGLVMAFCLHATLLAVRTAAELVSHEIGLGFGGMVDPTTGASTSSVTTLYETIFYLGLLLTNGHHALLRALDASFVCAPVGNHAIDVGVAESILALVCQMVAAGVVFAVPLLALLFATSLLVALLGRAIPQLNVNEIGFTLRTVVGLAGLYLFAPTLAPVLGELYALLFSGLQDAIAHLGG